MRGLTIVLGEPSPTRLNTALVLLLATQALGGRARLFLEGQAVTLAAMPPSATWTEALESGVEITLCQTGLAEADLSAEALDPRLAYAGPIALLQSLGDDRLLIG